MKNERKNIVTFKPFYVRNMLLQYDRQLVTAKRLARYHRSLGMGLDTDPIPKETKRRMLIERVAREIVENLLMSGSDSPIVAEIRGRLEEEIGYELVFEYPISEQDLQIFKNTPAGPMEVPSHEKMQIMNRLWKITLDKVDETML